MAIESLQLRAIADLMIKGNCILFLGAGVHCPPPGASEEEKSKYPPAGSLLAEYLLEEVREPIDDRETALRDETQALIHKIDAVRHVLMEKLDGSANATSMLASLRSAYQTLAGIGDRTQAGLPADAPDNLSDLTRVSQYILKQTSLSRLRDCIQARVEGGRQPSELLRRLARMPFRVIITTNYDSLMDQALRETQVSRDSDERKSPQVAFYRKNPKESQANLVWPPTVAKPLLYKFHGYFDDPTSMVITDKDYIEFLVQMGKGEKHCFPAQMHAALRTSTILFLGYSLRDQNLRVALKSLYGNKEPDWGGQATHYAVSRKPDRLVLDTFRPLPEVHGMEGDLWSFVTQLEGELQRRGTVLQ